MSDSKAVIETPVTYEADQLDRAEYQALETALLQTARGRNFLSEYLRRNGGDAVPARTMMIEEGSAGGATGRDTDKILQAVENLHAAVVDHQSKSGSDHIRMDILEMAKAISKTRSEISAMRASGDDDQLTMATGEMDAIVQSTEKATNDILQAAEKIQEVAWRLREAGTEEASCEEIDNCATEIYMACSFQDLTGQRTTKVVRVLQYLEARINSMIEIWGLTGDELGGGEGVVDDPKLADSRPDAHLLNGPQTSEAALGQENIDALLDDEPFEQVVTDDEPAPSQKAEDSVGDSAEDSAGDSAGAGELLSVDAIDDIFDAASPDEQIDEEQLKALFN